MQLTDIKESVCDCYVCNKMCQMCPCIGTPKEIQKLIEAGYSNRLMRDGDMVQPAVVGFEKREFSAEDIAMANETYTVSEAGRCTFHTGNKCELHELGLKPIEGRLAGHNQTVDGLEIRRTVETTWFNDNKKTLRLWLQNITT